jgi:hypothetical protein
LASRMVAGLSCRMFLSPGLTKKIHAIRSAAADLIHELACGYARGSDAGLAVTGPGFPAWPAARQRRRLARADII